MNAIKDQNLSPAQVTLLTRAMLSVAVLDGLHPAETTLIRQFYENTRSDDMPSTQAMIEAGKASQFKVSELSGSTPEFAETVFLMCLMTAYADGSFGQAEHDYISSIARALEITEDQLAMHLAHVHNDLIGALSNLPDSASVAKVFGELSSGL